MGLEKDCKLDLHGKVEKGPRNLITDVAGVKVAHVTLQSEDHNVNTGVTAILPHEGNVFREKLFAAASVINGFGKSVGLVWSSVIYYALETAGILGVSFYLRRKYLGL